MQSIRDDRRPYPEASDEVGHPAVRASLSVGGPAATAPAAPTGRLPNAAPTRQAARSRRDASRWGAAVL